MSTQVKRYTGSGAIAIAFDTPSNASRIRAIEYHGSAVGGAGTLTIAKDADAGAMYDVVILSQDMTATADIVQLFEGGLPLTDGDVLTITFANASTVTWGIQIYYETGV